MAAPTLVAKGTDAVALRIRETGEEHDIPIIENPPLARAIYATVEIGQEVQADHYKAVAEVIGYVMKIKGEAIRRKFTEEPAAVHASTVVSASPLLAVGRSAFLSHRIPS